MQKLIEMQNVQREFNQVYAKEDNKLTFELLDRFEELLFAVYPYVYSNSLRSLQVYERSLDFIRNSLKVKNYLALSIFLKKVWNPLVSELLNAHYEPIEQEIIIGLYDAKVNPLQSYAHRIPFLEKEAKRQNALLFYFSDSDIDLSRKTIRASYLDGEKVLTKEIDYPDVIYNVWADSFVNQSKLQYELRKSIPFMCHSFGDKIEVPQKILKNEGLASLIIPFVGVDSSEKVKRFLDKEIVGVLKPYRAARGEDVFLIEKIENDRYMVNHHGEKIYMDSLILTTWIKESLIPRGYILQKYVRCETSEGKPFDMRVLMQKNGQGKWCVRTIYPRVGKGDSIVSTTNEEEQWDIFDLFEKEYGKNADAVYHYLEKLGVEIATAIDREYGNAIEEQGLDLAIDHQGNVWMYESNNKPGTFGVAIEKRANYAIAYAKYLGFRQKFPTNEYQTPIGFNSKESKLPVWKNDERPIIGSLGLEFYQRSSFERKTFSLFVKDKGCIPMFFTFKDLDLVNQKVRGYTYEGGQYKEYIFPYPDAYEDRLRLRKEGTIWNVFYEHLEGVPCNYTVSYEENDFFEVHQKLKIGYPENVLEKTLIANSEDIIRLLDRYESVTLESLSNKKLSQVLYIQKKSERKFNIVEEDRVYKGVSLKKLEQFIDKRTEFEVYLAEEHVYSRTANRKPYSFSLSYGKKGRAAEWDLLEIKPQISSHPIKLQALGNGAYTTDISSFYEVEMARSEQSEEDLGKIARELVNEVARLLSEDFTYITIEMVYDEKIDEFKMRSFNFNPPYHEQIVRETEYNVDYCLSLLSWF